MFKQPSIQAPSKLKFKEDDEDDDDEEEDKLQASNTKQSLKAES